jgi:hypothetical protein
MRKIAVLAVAGALAAPAAAFAGDADTDAAVSPAKSCKTQRAEMGVTAFRALYGTNKNKKNAFGKCVSKQEKVQDEALAEAKENAPATCRAEREADPAAFAEKYGTSKNKKNAFGKCVSQTAKAEAKEEIAEHDDAVVAAAKACKAERKADPAAFAEKYGTNKNKKNAFGKCVSQTAKAQEDEEEGEGESEPTS